jgi:hypothetical protein
MSLPWAEVGSFSETGAIWKRWQERVRGATDVAPRKRREEVGEK